MDKLEAGIQFHLPTFRDCTLPDLQALGVAAAAAGFSQLWVTDNLQSRSVFVTLAALAARVPLKLGTAIMVPYFHNPVEAASSLAAITELMTGPELSIGVARGNPSTPHDVRTPKPISVLRETSRCLKRLLAGDAVQFQDYPTLASIFHLAPEASFQLHFRPRVPTPLYCGSNGPLGLAVGGQEMDGLIFGGTLGVAARTGRLAPLLAVADQASAAAGRPALRKVAEVKISLAATAEAARAFVREAVGMRVGGLPERGYTEEDYAKLAVAPAAVDLLARAYHGGAPGDYLASLVTEPMIDAFFIAGDPRSCSRQIEDLCSLARAQGFQQLMFSGLGPDPHEAIRLLSDAVLPVMAQH